MDYESLLEAARGDERVVGLVLTGSRGRGVLVREGSDWDVRVVVRDDALDECRRRYETPHGSQVEAAVLPLSEFARAGLPGSGSEWDRYSYVRAQVPLDRDGVVTGLVAAKAALAPDEARGLAVAALDAYVNAYFRSAKCLRLGLDLEAQLDAAESVPPFLTALFAVHGRVRPFNKFLRWELEAFPLGEETWRADTLLPRLAEIAATADAAAQQALFRDAERLARGRGLGDVIDGWEADSSLLRG